RPRVRALRLLFPSTEWLPRSWRNRPHALANRKGHGMSYVVKEVFFTLQGEGFNTGKAAVLCRFTGCNLWTGREEHRSIAVCQFCDTDFVGTDGPGRGRFKTADALADAVETAWRPGPEGERFVA